MHWRCPFHIIEVSHSFFLYQEMLNPYESDTLVLE